MTVGEYKCMRVKEAGGVQDSVYWRICYSEKLPE